MGTPAPPNRARAMKITRMMVASTLRYSARPPQTPASLRSVWLRYSLRARSMSLPFAPARPCRARAVAGLHGSVAMAVTARIGEVTSLPLQRLWDAGDLLGEAEPDELGASGDVELGEDLPEVVVDRPRAQEELGRHLAVGRPFSDEADDLELLRGELGQRARIALASGLAGDAQLHARPLRPGGGAELLEGGERRAQVLAGVSSAAGAAQGLAVQELRAGPVERPAAVAVQPQGFREMAVGGRAGRQQTAAARHERERPRRGGVGGPLLEAGQCGLGAVGLVGPDGG